MRFAPGLGLLLTIFLGGGGFAVATEISPPLAGSATSSRTLSWSQALALWQGQSRALRLARLQVDAAAGDQLAADVRPNPQLSLNLGQMAPGYVGGGGLRDKHIDKILRIDQLIERGNKRELRTQAATAQLEAAKHDLRDTERSQRVVLAQAFYGLLQAQEKRRLLEETAELYGNTLRAMEVRLKAGDVAPVEVARLRVEAARASNDARQARTEHAAAQQTLNYLLSLGGQAGVLAVSEQWPPMDEEPQGDVAAALAMRPDVLSSRARSQAAEHGLNLAKSLQTRDVTVGVQVEQCLTSSCGTPARSYGVGLSVPLFIGNTYEGEIRRAEAELEMVRTQQEQIEAQASADLEQARLALVNSMARRQQLENGVLADARLAAAGAELAYAKGAASLLEVLDARRTLRAIQLEAGAVRYEHAVAAAAWQAAQGK